jgi:hypothetical protein
VQLLAVQLLQHEPAQAILIGVWMGVRLESQAQVLGVVDDPLPPRDGLPVNDGPDLQKIGHVGHGLGRRPLDPNEVEAPAFDDELGGGIEEGFGFAHGLEKGKAQAKGARHGRPTRGGPEVRHAGTRIDEAGRMHVVADGQTGRVMSDGEPGPAAVLGDLQVDIDANPQLGLVGPGQNDLAVTAAVFRLGPGAALF